MQRPTIVKLGGSLFDLPDLDSRLRQWLQCERHANVLFLPGGGPAADVIRDLDRIHHLGEEASHWLALRMLQVNAQFLASLLPEARIVASPLDAGPLAILDAYAFAREDDHEPGRLRHTWDATSDSLAVRVAQVAQARELILLKSVTWQSNDWTAAARAGVVDAYLPEMMRSAHELCVRIVNLRTWAPNEIRGIR